MTEQDAMVVKKCAMGADGEPFQELTSRALSAAESIIKSTRLQRGEYGEVICCGQQWAAPSPLWPSQRRNGKVRIFATLPFLDMRMAEGQCKLCARCLIEFDSPR